MKCVFIVSPGENLEGASELHRLGYELEPYPCTHDLSSLTDSREEENGAFLGRPPSSAERPHVRSLRASFIRMLEDRRYDGNDLLIFGESDAVPMAASLHVEKALKKEMEEHPETDIFRLFHHTVWRPEGSPQDSDELVFEPFNTGKMDADTSYVWGTHAMVIPRRSRRKVARVFADYRLPTDIALEAANSCEDLHIRVCSHNLFYQHGRTPRRQDCRIAACLSSYKRLTDLQRQIWCMMDQSYSNLHVFAAVKGITEGTFRKTVLPLFEHFIQEGRLTLRLFPNKNQLSNILDTVRDLDVSGYDLFAKVDDDDLYGRDYFKSVNDFHLHLPPEFSSYYCGPGEYLTSRNGYPFAGGGFFGFFGPTLVFSRTVLDKLRMCEEDPARIPEISPKARHSGYGFIEDNLMHRIMLDTGDCNRTCCVKDMALPMHLVVQTNNASVMRGGLVPGDFRGRNWSISTNQDHSEHLFEIRHPGWHDLVRVFGNRAHRSERKDEATVLSLTDTEITLKWDGWGTESFRKDGDGIFHLAEKKSGTHSEILRNSNIAVLSIAGKKDIAFWKECYQACKRHFLTQHRVHYFLVTDHDEMETEEDVTLVRRTLPPGPMETLKRFETLTDMQEELQSCDYIYFLDCALQPIDAIGEEIFPTEEERLTVAIHPDYYGVPRSMYPYESNGMSEARIPLREGTRYLSGSFMGGAGEEFLCMCRELADSVNRDMRNGVVAEQYGESYLNKYISCRRPRVLGPEYLFPETISANSANLIAIKPKVKIIHKDRTIFHREEHS